MNTNANFLQKFTDIQKSVPKKQAFVAGNVTMSFGDLQDRLGRTNALFEKTGLVVGDRVMIASSHDMEVTVLYLAMLQFGLVAIVIDPQSSRLEMENLIQWSEPKVIFIDHDLASRITPHPAGTFVIEIRPNNTARKTTFGLLLGKRNRTTIDTESFPANTQQLAPEFGSRGEINDDYTALILFTSGTTSRPKGVELSRRSLFAQFETFEKHYGFQNDSKILNHLPLHHTDGLNQGAALAAFTGATWLRPKTLDMQNLPDIMDLIFREHATHMITVPTVLSLIMRLGPEFDDTFSSSCFRFVGSTAGHLEESLWREFESRFGVMVVNSYGLTETVSEAIYCGPNDETRRIGTIGKPVDCEARLVGSDGIEVKHGDVGEVAIRGTNVMKGYFRDPDATQAVFKDGWFLTGDLATQDDDGFFSIVGRKKNVIIRGGLNVYPEDITDSVLGMPGILDAITIGISDELLGERVVTCVTLATPDEPSPTQIVSFLRERLAPEKIPSDIYILENLPRGPAGKVLLENVKTIVDGLRDAATENLDGPINENVISVAASVFKIDPAVLGVHSTMKNTQGWDSLSHLEFVLQLERMADRRFSPRDIMKLSTLGDAINLLVEKIAPSEETR